MSDIKKLEKLLEELESIKQESVTLSRDTRIGIIDDERAVVVSMTINDRINAITAQADIIMNINMLS